MNWQLTTYIKTTKPFTGWKMSTVDYRTNEFVNGKLIITHFDLEKQIVSGTFWFDAVNAKGEKVEVREGRFDMQFTR